MTPAADPDNLNGIDELLTDLDSEDAESLKPVLAELRSLADEGPVLPNRRLAALLVDDAQPATAMLPLSQAAADLLRADLEDSDEATDDGAARATVVDLATIRGERASSGRSGGTSSRPGRKRRGVVTAVVVALAAAGTAGAAAVAQDGLGGGITSILGGTAPEQPSPHPQPTLTTPPAVEPHLAPAVPAPAATPSSPAAPASVAPDASKPATTAPTATPQGGIPAGQLPQLPVAPPSLEPAPSPSVPGLLPLPGVVPGSMPLPGLP